MKEFLIFLARELIRILITIFLFGGYFFLLIIIAQLWGMMFNLHIGKLFILILMGSHYYMFSDNYKNATNSILNIVWKEKDDTTL